MKEVQERIAKIKKSGGDASADLEERQRLSAEADALRDKENSVKDQLDFEINQIGNFVHESVPVSKDEVCFSFRGLFYHFQCVLVFGNDDT